MKTGRSNGTQIKMAGNWRRCGLILLIMAGAACQSPEQPAPELTADERQWLKEHDGRLRLGTEYQYDLYNDQNEGIYNGVSADFIRLIEHKLHFRFQIVRIGNWFEENQKVAGREVDVLNSLAGTTRFSRYMSFTRPYFEYPAFLVTRRDGDFPPAEVRGNGRIIVQTENNDLSRFLAARYPGTVIRVAGDPVQGLRDVSEGRAHAMVMSKVMFTFYAKKTGVTNLTLAGELDYQFQSSIACRNDWPLLRQIMDKGLGMIGRDEREAILRKWGLKQYFWNSARFWYVSLSAVAVIGVLVAVVLLWNSVLRHQVKRQTALIQAELEERKELQLALQASRNRYQLLSSATSEAVLVLKDERITDLNPQALQLTGFPREELTGRSLPELFEEEDRAKTEEHLKTMADTPLEIRLAARQAVPLTVEVRIKSIQEGGHSLRLAAIRDISARIQAEQEARRQQEELFHAGKMVALGIIVAGWAHEINNPNHAIAMNAGLLKDSWKSIQPVLEEYHLVNPDLTINGIGYASMAPRIPQLLDSIGHNSRRIQQIVSSLKDYSRKEPYTGKSLLEINTVAAEAVQILQSWIRQATRHFHTEFTDGLPRIQGNRLELEQLLVNLIQNACLALPDPSRGIWVSTGYQPERRQILLTVRDEGTGIDGTDLKHIQEPFFTTRRAKGGVGLGLFIASKIVANHGGTMHFDSAPGRGTVVTVGLPVPPEQHSTGA